MITDTVSGSSAIERRPNFVKLMDRLEHDDVLVVAKLGTPGIELDRHPTTVGWLAEMGMRVHCVALGGVDLTSPAGKMTMGVIFERDLLIERTLSGPARARAGGKKFGRRPVLGDDAPSKALQAGGRRLVTGGGRRRPTAPPSYRLGKQLAA